MRIQRSIEILPTRQYDLERSSAKVTVGVKGASKYYDHALITQIEKGTLLNNIDALSPTFDFEKSSSPDTKDTKLLSILQTEKEKGLDWISSAQLNGQEISNQNLLNAANVIKSFENPKKHRDSANSAIFLDGKTPYKSKAD